MTTRSTRRLATALAAALVLGVLSSVPSEAAGPPSLFTPGTTIPPHPGATRARTASITDALDGQGPTRVVLDLFDDASITVVLHRRDEGTAAVWTMGNPESNGRSVEIVVSGGYLSGSAHLPGLGSYSMFGPVDGTVLIAEADPSYRAVEAPIEPAPDSTAPPTASDDPPPVLPDALTPVIDVMFVITDDVITDSDYFREEPGNEASPVLTDQALHAALRAWGEARVATINEGFANSEIDAAARLVYAGKINYAETGSTGTDLDLLTFAADEDCEPGPSQPGIQECDPEGLLDEVRGLRDDFGADVVFLITYYSDFGGIAWLLCRPNMADPVPNTNQNCSPDYGYGVVDFISGMFGLSVSHELGHLLGGRHDVYNDPTETYARGHLVPTDFGTVMAYPCTPESGCDEAGDFADRINHFSNPDVDYTAQPTGVAIGEIDAADMASHLTLSAPIIAAFRDAALCGGKPVTIFGTPFADTIVGTDGNDVILALDGRDLIHAGAGNDRVCGGLGGDEIYGQGGKDRIWGGKGGDHLVGNSARDRLYGQRGNDDLDGGSGRDRLVGGKHLDDLDGGGGPNDVCKSGETITACETVI